MTKAPTAIKALVSISVADDIRAEHSSLGSFEVHFLDNGEVA